eukprot:12413784-Karenia_brevis.AAC.1
MNQAAHRAKEDKKQEEAKAKEEETKRKRAEAEEEVQRLKNQRLQAGAAVHKGPLQVVMVAAAVAQQGRMCRCNTH